MASGALTERQQATAFKPGWHGGPGRPKGSLNVLTRLERARDRAEKRHKRKFEDLLFDLAYRSTPSNPTVAVALAKKFYPDRTFTESDRQPTQIIFIDRIPDPPGPLLIEPSPTALPGQLTSGSPRHD